MSSTFFRAVHGGVFVDIRLTPRGGRDQIDGVDALSDGRQVLRARVRAVPEKGAANAALELLIARALDWPRSAVDIQSGQTARVKTVRIAGDAEEIQRRLLAAIQQ